MRWRPGGSLTCRKEWCLNGVRSSPPRRRCQPPPQPPPLRRAWPPRPPRPAPRPRPAPPPQPCAADSRGCVGGGGECGRGCGGLVAPVTVRSPPPPPPPPPPTPLLSRLSRFRGSSAPEQRVVRPVPGRSGATHDQSVDAAVHAGRPGRSGPHCQPLFPPMSQEGRRGRRARKRHVHCQRGVVADAKTAAARVTSGGGRGAPPHRWARRARRTERKKGGAPPLGAESVEGSGGGSSLPSVEPSPCSALLEQISSALRASLIPCPSRGSLPIRRLRLRPGHWPRSTLLDRLEPAKAVDHHGRSRHERVL